MGEKNFDCAIIKREMRLFPLILRLSGIDFSLYWDKAELDSAYTQYKRNQILLILSNSAYTQYTLKLILLSLSISQDWDIKPSLSLLMDQILEKLLLANKKGSCMIQCTQNSYAFPKNGPCKQISFTNLNSNACVPLRDPLPWQKVEVVQTCGERWVERARPGRSHPSPPFSPSGWASPLLHPLQQPSQIISQHS